MYLKLAFRNAKRSITNYLLYITTMTILVALMTISNCIAITGKVQGFQTASLPLLITLILTILAGYINSFMFKERAKEFANYLLLGMERNNLLWMFLTELLVIGLMCYIIGSLIGLGIYILLCPFQHIEIQISFMLQSLMQSFLYFCIVEFISIFWVKTNIDKLEIRELMIEKKRNPKLGDKRKVCLWGTLFMVSLFCLVGLILGIAYLPDNVGSIMISIIALPLFSTVFTFYKWLFLFLAEKRQTESDFLYEHNRLYVIAQMTTESVIMNGIFSICLIFSGTSFVFGTIMLQQEITIFDVETRQWMGFLQISLCIVFIVIYFSILSLQQIIELRQRVKDIALLHYIGKDRVQIKKLIRNRILTKLSLPTVMCIIPLLIAAPFVNNKLNTELSAVMQNIVLKSVGWFFICFLILYLCYFFVVWVMCKQYAENSINTKSK